MSESPAKKETVYLIDASGYIFRAYYAIRSNLTTKSGLPTNAVFGFTKMLIKLIQDEKPAYLVPIFDVSRKSFRTDMYPEYKANRSDPPEDLAPQFPLIREVVEAFQFPPVEMENYEADDLIGTIAEKLNSDGYPVCIITSDKDMMQLVGEEVWLVDTWKNKVIREQEVEERFGVPPEKVIDVLGLAGDSSDNVPGVPGVGEKTAIALVQEFGSMEGVLASIDSVKGKKRQENLRDNSDLARLSRELVTIKRDVPIAFDLEQYRVRGVDAEKAHELFDKLEFSGLLEQVGAGDAIGKAADAVTLNTDAYTLVDDDSKLEMLIGKMKKASVIALDTETRSTNSLEPDLLVGIAIAVAEGDAYYIPVSHSAIGVKQLDKQSVLEALKPLFNDSEKHWVMQNAKFDLQVMQTEGVLFAGKIDDTMLLSYVADPSARSHGLDNLAQTLLGHKMIPFSEVAGKGKKQITFDQVDTKTACRYSAEDADATYRLFEILSKRVEDTGLTELYETLERPLVPVLQKMERDGILVDKKALDTLTATFDRMLLENEQKIYEEAGREFNINSPKQLGEILFDELGLPKGRKTKTGYSTDVSVLQRLAAKHPLPELILDYRQVAKLKSTYTEALVRLIDPQDGRIHTSFNQTIALTGRLSSSDPNLQNIPVRTDAGRMIRQAFIPREGTVLLSADYSQVELRILAHISEDPILQDAFNKDEDVHSRTAAEVFGLLPGLVDREMRRRAKAVNFGIVYGQTAFGLAESLDITRSEAQTIITSYFERYAGVKKYLDGQRERGKEDKRVQTLFGRVIPLNDIDARNQAQRGYAERVAINAPIQGSAADIIKIAMIRIADKLKQEKLESRMLLQVHDELVFEVPEAELDDAKNLVVYEMEHAADLAVDLKVDVGVGANWDEAH